MEGAQQRRAARVRQLDGVAEADADELLIQMRLLAADFVHEVVVVEVVGVDFDLPGATSANAMA